MLRLLPIESLRNKARAEQGGTSADLLLLFFSICLAFSLDMNWTNDAISRL